jgi:hypothetical protein
MVSMEPQRFEHNGWTLTVAPGRTCVGSAAQHSPPHQILMVKGFSAETLLVDPKRQIDAIEGLW